MAGQGYRLDELAGRVGATVRGDGAVRVWAVASLKSAGPGEVAFYSRGGFEAELRATQAGAVIVAAEALELTDRPALVSANPYLGFARVSQILNPVARPPAGIAPGATVAPGALVDPTASIGPNVAIGAGAEIGPEVVIGAGSAVGEGARIGAGTRLHANVTVYDRCVIGKRCIVHSGAVIGADGFGFAPDRGAWVKIPQVGRVVIGDDVEIGANTTIDRGALDDTVIEEGVKLDNQIQVGHNCVIGAHTAIAGCVGMAGSARIGRHCMIGGAAMIAGHLSIADRVVVAGGTLVSRSINQAGAYAGVFPFDEQKRWQRTAVHVRNLDTLAERVKELEREVAKLRNLQG